MRLTPQVRVERGFNAPGFPKVWEVYAKRRYQLNWTLLRVYTSHQNALADAELIRRRGFNKEEKDMMKGAG